MNIEQFIKENRADFDREIPDAKIWAGIEKTLDSAAKVAPEARIISLQNNRKRWQFLAAAASLLLVGALAGFIVARQNTVGGGANPEIALQNVSPEAAEAEQYYVRTISAKTQQLEANQYHSDQVEGDLAAIDRAMTELKHELANVPPGQRAQVVHALIENYQIKLKILEKVLDHVDAPQSPSPAIVDSLNLKSTPQNGTKSI
jgi:hypothetical protein